MDRPCSRWMVCLLALVLLPVAGAGQIDVESEVKRLLDAGEAQEAVETIEAHSPASARDAQTWFLLAEVYHVLMDRAGLLRKRGLAKKMKGALESALEVDPSHLAARRELADFLWYAPRIVGGSKDRAAEQLALLEQVDAAEAYAVRGDHARDRGDRKAAREHYRKALELDPSRTSLRLPLAVIEQQDGDYAESIRLLDEAIARAPELEKAYYYRARASAMSGQDIDRGLECAEYYVEHCRECDDSDRGYGWWRRATLLKHKNDPQAAIAAYQEALRWNPELKGARQGLAELER